MDYFVGPSVKRASGLLPPAAGASSRLGAFYSQPYFWVIDDQSDATFVPSITTRSGGDLNVEYRRRFDRSARKALRQHID